MKVYVVFKGDYYYLREVLKIFSDLDKAIDYATDVVMEQINKYNRDYVKETIRTRYNNCSSHGDSCGVVYANHLSMDSDEYSVGILEVDAEI